MKAHQRLIRERRAAESADADIFGQWWLTIDVEIGKAEVREIAYATASAIILQYEWLGTMPAYVRHSYGIFFDGCCAGAVTYSDEMSENLGVWDKYGFTGKMLCLSRGACVHWAHPHAASKLIRGSMRLLPDRYKVITATVDSAAGEVGTIYQACGFDFIGAKGRGRTQINGVPSRTLRKSRYVKPRRHGLSGDESDLALGDVERAASVSEGRARALWPRRGRSLGGMASQRKLLDLGIEFEPVNETQKGRYFAFRGSHKERKALRAAIAHLIAPYPKRAL